MVKGIKMLSQTNDILEKVDSNRIADLALKLVQIPSHSGEEAEATSFLAKYLHSIGLDVEVDRSYPESPSIIAYVRGSVGGPTLQLDGHIDHGRRADVLKFEFGRPGEFEKILNDGVDMPDFF